MYVKIDGITYGGVTFETLSTPSDGDTCSVELDGNMYSGTVDDDTLTITYPQGGSRKLNMRFDEGSVLVYEISAFGFSRIKIDGTSAILASVSVGTQSKVTVGETKTYTEFSDLQFVPETDVTGNNIPINELWVNIHTDDLIQVGQRISLYDDMDNLWAKYWITYAEHEESYIRRIRGDSVTYEREYTMRIHGQSLLMRLETVTLDAVMYQNEPVQIVLAEVLASLDGEYSLDEAFTSKTISGYAPKQTARVRLQWICMCIGAYVKNFFNDALEILEMNDEDVGIIPLRDTYWKPKVTYRDYVTAVRATYYSFVEDVPSRTDKYVTIGDKSKGEEETYYVQTSTEVTLRNNEVPEAAPENVVEIDGVTLLNINNVDSVLSFLAKYYFKRTEVDLSCINNATFMPGQKVMCYTDEETMYSGYINSCSFSFGVQAKSDVHMTPTETKDSANLFIRYMYGGNQIDVRPHRFPIGYQYEVENEYIDKSFNGHRYVFRPIEPVTAGTMVEGNTEVDVNLEVALDYAAESLFVRSVDSFAMLDGIVVIG